MTRPSPTGSAGSAAGLRQGRIPQFDGLRAVALIAVLYCHFWAGGGWSGVFGVSLFFVLSGYLITRILLAGRGRRGALKTFLVRRSLRIFPIFYLTLAAAALLDLGGIRASLPWHLLYGSNIWFALRNSLAAPWPAAHLWSLAVEEQFYLAWPWLILFLPRQALAPTVWMAIAASLLYRLLAPHAGLGEVAAQYLTPACLDRLGAGALLALSERAGRFPGWLPRAGGLAAALFAALWFAPYSPLVRLAQESAMTVALSALVAAAAEGIRGPVGAALGGRPLRQLGRVSYAGYLFHLFVWAAAMRIAAHVPGVGLGPGSATFVVMSSLTLASAALSWRLVEAPIARLKGRIALEEPVQPAPRLAMAGAGRGLARRGRLSTEASARPTASVE